MTLQQRGLLVCLAISVGCRPTGYCQTDDDCSMGALCNMQTHRCPDGPPVALTVAVPEGGTVRSTPVGIECPGACTASFPEGSAVALRATPGATFHFAGWAGACSGPQATCAIEVKEPVNVAASFMPKVCAQDGWCWENPLPQGYDLEDVWAVADDDVWAVGAAGTVLRWDGKRWAAIPSGTTATLRSIWGVAGDMWIVGDASTILRYNGSIIKSQQGPVVGTLWSVHGTGPSNIWIGADSKTVLRWDGARFTSERIGAGDGSIRSVWTASPTDTWAAGDGLIRHWDGAWKDLTQLSVPPQAIDSSWRGVFKGKDGVIWIAGNKGYFVRCAVGTMCSGVVADSLGGGDIGGSPASSNIWAVGERGTMLRWNDPSWERVFSDTGYRLTGVTGVSSNLAWAVGEKGAILRAGETSWAAESTHLINDVGDMWGGAADNIWVAADRGGMIRWDGATWTQVNTGIVTNFASIWGLNRDDIWAGGPPNSILHWNGREWTVVGTPMHPSILAIGGSATDDVWATSAGGFVTHWDGARWSQSDQVTDSNLDALWANDRNDVWAAGRNGTTIHWDGKRWSAFSSGTTSRITSLWGTGTNDVWATGENIDAAFHWDGNKWSARPFGQFRARGSISGHGPNEVWFAGTRIAEGQPAGGLVARWKGTSWDVVTSTAVELYSVYVASPADIWVAGAGGTVLHYQK